MVSEQYPREEDDAFAFYSNMDEDDESIDPASSSAILETSSSHDRIVFGRFDSPIIPVSNHSIIQEFDGISIEIGEIFCVLLESYTTSSMVMIMSLPFHKRRRN